MPSSPSPRDVAFEVALAVERDGAYANLVLPGALARSGMDERDKGFVTQLVYGSLRAQGELDAVIAEASNRDPASLDDDVLVVLRLGVYQLLHMRVESHAAVDESVRLTKSHHLHRVSGLVNAVLRAVASHSVDYWDALVAQSTTSIHSHPSWIAAKMASALAECDGADELSEALESHNQPPLVTLCHLPGFAQPPEATRTALSPVGSTLLGGNPGELQGVREGTVRVQDEGSQLVALALTRSEPLQVGDRVWDMCAGPGGKTALLAAEACPAGAIVLASEISAHRAALVEDSVAALRAQFPDSLSVEICDSTEPRETQFHRILLDAPCSGLGALRRRPEARWKKSPDSIPGLVELQRSLLRNGLESLAPGGILAYVTCSPVAEETSGVLKSVLGEDPRFSLMDSGSIMEGIVRGPIAGHRRGMAVQLWTHRHGTDAMFLQLIRRNSSIG